MHRLTAAAGALVAALLLATDAHAASSYCSPTGDVCYGVQKRGGVVRVHFGSFAHRGRVRVCTTAPSRRRECEPFRLRHRGGGVFGFTARWSAHFRNEGPGRYRLRFTTPDGQSLGPAVSFAIGR